MPLAVAHNCSFFECFERRFPCKAEYGISHVVDFELTSCREFYKEYDTFDQHVRTTIPVDSCVVFANVANPARGE